MLRVLLSIAVVAACGRSDAEQPPPAKLDQAKLDELTQIEVPGFAGDLVPGMIEGHANRRYTGRVAGLPVDVGVVVSFGVCSEPCTPTDDSWQRSHKPRELFPSAQVDPDIEVTPTTFAGHPAVAAFGVGFGKGAAFAQLTILYNNGVNELRVKATIWGPVPGVASKADARAKLPRSGFETAVQTFLPRFVPYF